MDPDPTFKNSERELGKRLEKQPRSGSNLISTSGVASVPTLARVPLIDDVTGEVVDDVTGELVNDVL